MLAKSVLVVMVLTVFGQSVSARLNSISAVKDEIENNAPFIRNGRELLDALRADPSFSLAKIMYLMEIPDKLGDSHCRSSTQVLLKRAKATGVASNFLEGLYGWVEDYCAVFLRQTMKEGIDKLTDRPRKFLDETYGKVMSLTSEQAVVNEKVRAQLDTIDSSRAEFVLSADQILSPDVVVELLKKVEPNNVNFALGSLGDLKRVSELNAEECHVDELNYIFGKAYEFMQYKQAPAVFMQNLAAQQYKVCQSPGTSIVEMVAAKISEKSRQLVEEFAKEVPTDIRSNTFGKVIAGLKRVAEKKVQGGNVFESYGKQLSEACHEVLASFRPYNDAIKTFCDASKSEITSQWVEINEYCYYTPGKVDARMYINSEWSPYISEESDQFGLTMSKYLGIGNSKQVVESDKILEKLEKHARCYLKEKGVDAKEADSYWTYGFELNICDSDDYRENLLWLSQNGYPFSKREKLATWQTIVDGCKLVNSIGGRKVVEEKLESALKGRQSFHLKMTRCI